MPRLARLTEIAARCADAIVGAQCGLCGAGGPDPCPACRDEVAAAEGARWRCVRCAEPLGVPRAVLADESAPMCARCRRDPPAYDGACCAAAYAPPLDRIELALKFGHRAEGARTLGALLAARLARQPLRLDALIPVPLAPARLAERGYNQAGLIARRLARAGGLMCRESALVRVRPTPRVADLGRDARRAAVEGAFAAPARLDGQVIGLVDDVMTTGATMHAAALALKAAGAAQVFALAALRAASE